MKLQSASKKEIIRITKGILICDAALVAIQFGLSLVGVGTFQPLNIFLGVLGGSFISIANFTIMCLTIQKAVQKEDKKQQKTLIQTSYNLRLGISAFWVVAAFIAPVINVISAAAPLLFPSLIIYYLQYKGKLVEPSERKNPPEESQEEPQDRLESFEA